MPRLALIGAWLCAFSVAHGAPPASPQPPPKTGETAAVEEAKRHFLQGVALYNEASYSAALAEFEAANRAHDASVVLYNIGLCQKGLFRYAEAMETFHRYLVEAEAGKSLAPDRKAEVEQMVREMAALLVEVTLAVTPDGARVLVDERSAGATPLAALKLAAGHHAIGLSADGYEPARRELDLFAGMPAVHLAVHLELIPKLDLARDGQRGTVALQRSQRFRPWEHWWFWGLGVLCAAGIVVALAVPLSTNTESPLAGTFGYGVVGR